MIQPVLLLSLVTASISYTATETKLFKPLRERVRGESLLGRLLSCGHWVALAVVVIQRPRRFDAWWLLGSFLTTLAIAWLGGVQWVLMCLLMDKAGKGGGDWHGVRA